MGYLLDVTGLDGAKVDRDARRVEASVSLPAGGQHVFRLNTLAPRNSAATVLSVSLHAAHYPSGTEVWEHQTVAIDTRPASGGIVLGPVRLTTAGLAVVGWLLVSGLAWVILRYLASKAAIARGVASRGNVGALAMVAALMIPVGFWMVFAGLAWHDYQVLTVWREAPATIVGRRMLVHTESSSTDNRPAGSRNRSQTETTTVTPEYALRYEVDGQTIFSTGYDTGSALHIGGHVARAEELRDWTPGKVIPCWYDPGDPQHVVVRRGFGGAYFFALIPLPVFWIGFSRARRLLSSPRPATLPGPERATARRSPR
jgi:hypothetical protein